MDIITPLLSLAASTASKQLGPEQGPPMPSSKSSPDSFTNGIGDMIVSTGQRYLDSTVSSALSGMEGKAAGKYAKAYHDMVHPNTSAYERLNGGSAPGQPNAAANTAQVQERMQKRQLATQERIAKMNNATQIHSSHIASAPAHRQAGVAEQKLVPEIQKLNAETARTFAEVTLTNLKSATEKTREELTFQQALLTKWQGNMEKAKQELSKEYAKAGLNSQVARNLATMIMEAQTSPEELQRMLIPIIATGGTRILDMVESRINPTGEFDEETIINRDRYGREESRYKSKRLKRR